MNGTMNEPTETMNGTMNEPTEPMNGTMNENNGTNETTTKEPHPQLCIMNCEL
jgi:hypothetical protein